MTAMRVRDPEGIRVLFLSDHLGLPEGAVDGATTYFLNILPSLAATGIDLTVCFLRGWHPVANHLEERGVEPIFLGRRKWDPLAMSDILDIIRMRESRILHCAGMKGMLLGRWAAHLEGRRAIIHLHDLNDPGALVGTLQRRMSEWTDLALAISGAVARHATTAFDIPPDRVRVVRNAIPTGDFEFSARDRQRIRAELDLEPAAGVIGILGRVVPDKGHKVLMRALHRVLSEIPDARLVIVGEGPLRAELSAIAESLGISGAVRFTGFREDIAALLSGMDVVTIPSLAEGLGFVALEAMAAGRPVVASNTGGLPEVVEDGTSGLLVPPGNERALADALTRVLRESLLAERLAAGGRERVLDFSIAGHVDTLIAEYRRLVAPESSDPVAATGRRKRGSRRSFA